MSANRNQGFTLIEMLVVLAILSILAMMVLPSEKGKVDKVRISETLKLIEQYKPDITTYYQLNGEFPANNAVVGMPAPDKIIGNFMVGTTLENGAIHLELGNKISAVLSGKVITVRPIFVPGEPAAPVSWICGYDVPPANMLAAGSNRTDVAATLLPVQCR